MKRPPRAILWGALLVAVLLGWLAYRHFQVGSWLTLENLKQSHQSLVALYAAHPWQTLATFFVVYVVATAVSIPGAVILTLAAGALFGFSVGLVLVSFASSLGALAAFLAARYLLRDAIQQRFGKALARINQGVEQDGTFYLLTLRLVPLFPFWLINLLMGLTPMRASRYYGVSQLGMLPGTAVYINAGTQLANIRSTHDILSAQVLGSLVLLGVFPLLAKALLAALQKRKVYAGWTRPAHFDRNLVVIGAGAAGLVSSYIAATVRARVTLVESHEMGGDCLNTGCVPSKALIRSARLVKDLNLADTLGVDDVKGTVDFARIMRRVHGAIQAIAPHDSVERYRQLGVDVVKGHAKLHSPWEVDITLPDGQVQRLTTRNMVIATGAEPVIPNIAGIEQIRPLTSENLWQLKTLPARLLVLGAGPIGCEMAQSFALLGSQVTLVERGPHVLPREDAQARSVLAEAMKRDGVAVLLEHEALRIETSETGAVMVAAGQHGETRIGFDQMLCATGRRARLEGFGLEALGLHAGPGGTLPTNARLQTRYPNIYAVGDAAGPFQLTHAAAHQAWHAVVNALFGRFKTFTVDYRCLPRCTFTSPEVAQVGLTEADAKSTHIPYEVTHYDLADLDRAIADGQASGFVKVLTPPGKDRILGVTIVGHHAAEMLPEFVLAMKNRLGLGKILSTIHAYPTWAEANKYAAGEWKKRHAPERILAWLERFHRWERGQ